ncbi:unnamed protein product, partial [Polarella glacialis]
MPVWNAGRSFGSLLFLLLFQQQQQLLCATTATSTSVTLTSTSITTSTTTPLPTIFSGALKLSVVPGEDFFEDPNVPLTLPAAVCLMGGVPRSYVE